MWKVKTTRKREHKTEFDLFMSNMMAKERGQQFKKKHQRTSEKKR
jgi:hypothetical protein